MKYPALNPGVNLKTRKDYIEIDYVNGVKNDKGECVIRPLNEEEKEFLNQFYRETVVASLSPSQEIKLLTKCLRECKRELKLIEEARVDIKRSETYLKYIEILELLKESREDSDMLYTDYEDVIDLYGENNSRNRCLYNISKSSTGIISLDVDIYDRFIAKCFEQSGLDLEHIMLGKDILDLEDED